MNINLVAMCYRGSYFYRQYGPAIRDLQVLLTLKQFENVSVTVIERPITIHERVLGKLYNKALESDHNIEVYDTTVFDLLGPLRRRQWFQKSVPKFLDKILPSLLRDDMLNIFLDFMPVGTPTQQSLEGWFYWYDFVDNFTKHNRFNRLEREAASRKYAFVRHNAKLLTFVTEQCRENVDPGNITGVTTKVLTNKLFLDPTSGSNNVPRSVDKIFDFGFVGFITDKIDLPAITSISKSHSVAIYGDFYDESVKSKLVGIPNVTLFGGFEYGDLPHICRTFKVGLLPYLAEKSHDGSPLKLYEYLRHGRPILTSLDYEITHENFIINYGNLGLGSEVLSKILSYSGSPFICDLLTEQDYLDFSLRQVLELIVRQSTVA